MWFEGLERRALLSATVNGSGQLVVTGTEGDDAISLRLGRDEATGAAQVIVIESARPADPVKGAPPPARPAATVTRIALSSLTNPGTKIVVNALGGDDAVGVKGPRSNPFVLAAEINGGAGDDRLGGGGGADAMNGGDGHDRVEGGDGADVLHGDAGNDRVDGGRGADYMFGDAGNDHLTAADRGEVDVLDGGANDPVTGKSVVTNPDGTTTRRRGNPGDVAVVDAVDAVDDVEKSDLAKARKGATTTTTTPPPIKRR